MGIEPRALAAMIDHTLLAPEATSSDITRLCAEAVELGVGTVCVSPSHVAFAHGLLPATIQVASVVGFPSGAHRSEVKALEAGLALENGAIEIDMVINLAHVLSGNWRGVEDDVAEVVACVAGMANRESVETNLRKPPREVEYCTAIRRTASKPNSSISDGMTVWRSSRLGSSDLSPNKSIALSVAASPKSTPVSR